MKRQQILYLQVAEILRKELLDGTYPVGTKIPTEGELEERFKVSKITIRKAVELLSNEGYLEKKSGVGTTVLSNRIFNHLSKGESFSAILEKEGHFLEKRILKIEKETVTGTNEKLKELGETILKITRIYYFENQPFVLFTHFIPGDVKDVKKENLGKKSLYHLLAMSGYEVARFRDSFQLKKTSPSDKELLNYKEETILERTRQAFDNEERLIEISYAAYNTDLQPYMIEFEV